MKVLRLISLLSTLVLAQGLKTEHQAAVDRNVRPEDRIALTDQQAEGRSDYVSVTTKIKDINLALGAGKPALEALTKDLTGAKKFLVSIVIYG